MPGQATKPCLADVILITHGLSRFYDVSEDGGRLILYIGLGDHMGRSDKNLGCSDGKMDVEAFPLRTAGFTRRTLRCFFYSLKL